MPNFGGPRYPARNRRADVLRGQVLGVSVRRAEQDKPVRPLKLAPTRRGLLEAIGAGKVRYVASYGWRCGSQTVNGVVQDCVRGGWVTASTVMGAETIALTDEGRKAIGLDDAA